MPIAMRVVAGRGSKECGSDCGRLSLKHGGGSDQHDNGVLADGCGGGRQSDEVDMAAGIGSNSSSRET